MDESTADTVQAEPKGQAPRAFPWHRTAIRAVLACAVVVATVMVFRGPVRDEAFMGDETDWISSGNYYTSLLVAGDFTHNKWVANELGIVGSFNQQLGKVLLGLGVRLHPRREPGDTEYITLYNWGITEEANSAQGRVPQEGLLVRARESSLVFVAGCAVVLFFAGTVVGGEAAGVVLVALMLGSTMLHRLFALAMTDSYYNFFLLLGLLSSVGLVRAEGARRFVGYSAAMGLAAGLACSVKITGLPVVAIFYCALLPGIWFARGFSLGTVVYGPLTALATAVSIVYILNPFFWPFESPRLLWEFPNLFIRTRQAFVDVPEAARMWGTPPDRWGAIHERLFRSGFSSFRWEPVFFAVGLAVSGWRFVSGLRRKHFSVMGIPFVYFVVQYVFVVSLIQFNFARYFVPVVFSMKLLAAVGVTWPLYWAWTQLSAREPQGDDAADSAEGGGGEAE